jgi:hypothetical protein
LIEICIYSFLNAKERANLRLLSQFFYQNFNDLYFNPYKILYPRLNLIERKLNDQFIDNVCMAYLFKSKDNPHFFMCSNKNFEEGLILKETWWMESNLNLQNYGSRTFKLDISGGNGSVQISDSVLSNEQVTMSFIFHISQKFVIRHKVSSSLPLQNLMGTMKQLRNFPD